MHVAESGIRKCQLWTYHTIYCGIYDSVEMIPIRTRGKKNGLKFFKSGSTYDWENLDNGDELYLKVTMLFPMR